MRRGATKFPRGFERFRAEAERLARDPAGFSRLLESAGDRLRASTAQFTQVRGDFNSLLRLLKAYSRGEYKQLPWSTLIMALAAVLYFINPLDLIPDFLSTFGLIDDVTVIAFCLGVLRRDLQAFLDWEKAQGSRAD